MQQFQNAETTVVRRHLYFHAVDATDGITPETGLTGAGRLSKNGATTAASASITEIDSTNMPGRYYVVLTTTELNTDGMIEFRFKTAACAEVIARGQVVPWDPYAITNMGLTALPAVAAEGAGGLYTRGTGVGQINQGNAGEIDAEVTRIAANAITTTSINNNAITNAKLATDVITADSVADNTITGGIAGQLASNCVGAQQLDTAAVQEIVNALLDEASASHVSAGSVGLTIDNLPNDGQLTKISAETDKIAVADAGAGVSGSLAEEVQLRSLAATAFDPATDDVDVRAIQANVITTASINANAITSAKIAGSAIGSTQIGLNAITPGKIASDAISAASLSTASVDKIRDAILDEATASHVLAGTVGLTLDNLPNDGALTDLAPSSTAFDPASDDVDVRSLQASVITATSIATDAIQATKIQSNAIGASELNNDCIGAGQLSATAVDKIIDAIRTDSVTSLINDAGPLVGDFNGASGLSTTDDFYNGCVLVFTNGALAGIARRISNYIGSSRNLQFLGTGDDADSPFPTVPADTNTFLILGRIGA